ncbi:MAG: hypothetical protein M5F18_09630 [Asgard group archaeon]|nr:hypothetical protein [Asgard group archaeon]
MPLSWRTHISQLTETRLEVLHNNKETRTEHIRIVRELLVISYYLCGIVTIVTIH